MYKLCFKLKLWSCLEVLYMLFSRIWAWVSIYYFIFCSSMHKFLFSWVFWAPKFDYNSFYGICKYSVSYVFIMEFFFLSQPKLTMARCRRNVDNFLEACRKIGVEEVGSNNHHFFWACYLLLSPFYCFVAGTFWSPSS